MRVRKQINKIKICECLDLPPYPYGGFVCVSPDGRNLEQFEDYYDAEKFCKETLDFLKRKP